MNCKMVPITLNVAPRPCFARLVRMTAANVAMLSSMSIEKIEDIKMAADEAFTLCCMSDADIVRIGFMVDDNHMTMTYDVSTADRFNVSDESLSYAELLLTSVCDDYQKNLETKTITMELRADV